MKIKSLPDRKKYHIFVGNKTGYVFTINNEKPIKIGERMKYMGFTYDLGWPKNMSTGRKLYKAYKKKKITQAIKKLIPYSVIITELQSVPLQE